MAVVWSGLVVGQAKQSVAGVGMIVVNSSNGGQAQWR